MCWQIIKTIKKYNITVERDDDTVITEITAQMLLNKNKMY